MGKIIFFALAFFLSDSRVTKEEIACVQYQRQDYSRDSAYRVPTIVFEGEQLNEIAETRKYKSYSNYAVVLWGNGRYSAIVNYLHIKMNFHIFIEKAALRMDEIIELRKHLLMAIVLRIKT